jgi:hypothetical protein
MTQNGWRPAKTQRSGLPFCTRNTQRQTAESEVRTKQLGNSGNVLCHPRERVYQSVGYRGEGRRRVLIRCNTAELLEKYDAMRPYLNPASARGVVT